MKQNTLFNDKPDENEEERCLPQGCQVERKFTEDQWAEFVACAARTWESGKFRHDTFEKKRKVKHPEATDERVREAIHDNVTLVAYRDDGMERVAIYDPYGTNLLIVTTMRHGIITAYDVDDFERSMKSKTDKRWLHEL